MKSRRSTAASLRRRASRYLPTITFLLLSLLVGLYAAQALLERRIAEGADTLLHLFRLAQVDALLDQGILFSRWSPDLAYGYGYPLFNYYAPLSYYAAELLHLAGLALPAAFVATFVLIFIGASAGAFLWARELVGAPAAIVSAAAYALSPYLMINLLHRGALAESLSLALLPLIFWLAYRAVIYRQRRYRLATVLLFAALILTHNISALILAPILAVYILLLEFGKFTRGHQSLLSIGSALGSDLWLLALAIILAAWYWLPALGEQDLVQISQTFGPDDFRYENNFLALSELLSGPFFLDVKLGNQAFPHAFNLVALILAILGLASLANRTLRRIDRLHIWFAAIATLICAFLILRISTPLWDVLPLIKFLQFPWRFLGVATLLLALLAGYGIRQLHLWLEGRPGATSLTTAAAILVLALYIAPWTFVERLESIESVTMVDSVAHELESGALGTTSAGEYLPVHVRQLPDRAQIQAAQGEERLASGSLPANSTILEYHYSPLDYRIVVDSPAPFTALFNTFFFEGWTATVDGNSAPLFPADGSGLISLDVPAGTHTLELAFRSTRLRRLAAAISLAGLALVAGRLIVGRHKAPLGVPGRSLAAGISWLMIVAVLGALLVGVLARDFYLDSYAPANSRYDGAVIRNARVNLGLNFDDRLALIGMDSPAEIAADEELELTLFWRAPVPIQDDHSVSVVLLDGAGNVFGQSDSQHIGDAPTSHWRPGKYIADEHAITLLPGAPPGEYNVAVAVYEYGRPGDRLDVLDDLGNPAGQLAQIEQIAVGRPTSTPSLDLPAIDVPVAAGVSLVGFLAGEDSVRAGEEIGIDLYWRANADPATDLTTELSLRNAAGETFNIDRFPLVSTYPTSLWEAGDLWLGRHKVVVPPTISGGDYTLSLRGDGTDWFALAPLTVVVPEHIMEPPLPTFPQDVRFGDVARLVGYDAPASAGATAPLSVTVYWNSLGQTRGNYRSFVQILDEEGRFVGGSDQVPAAWQRPTTGWVEGEYIADEHILILGADLPPGLYHLSAGLYDAHTSQRLLTQDGRDSVIFGAPLAITGE